MERSELEQTLAERLVPALAFRDVPQGAAALASERAPVLVAWAVQLLGRAALPLAAGPVAERLAAELSLAWHRGPAGISAEALIAVVERRVARWALGSLDRDLARLLGRGRRVRAPRIAALVEGQPLDRVARAAGTNLGAFVSDLRAALADGGPDRTAPASVAPRLVRLFDALGLERRGQQGRAAAALERLAAAAERTPEVRAERVAALARALRADGVREDLDRELALALGATFVERPFYSWVPPQAGRAAPDPVAAGAARRRARALLERRSALDSQSLATGLWRARWRAAGVGPQAGLQALPPSAGRTAPQRTLLLRERVELLLEAGRPRAARALLSGQPGAVARSRRLSELERWTRWICREGGASPPPASDALPARLAAALGSCAGADVDVSTTAERRLAGLDDFGAQILVCLDRTGAVVEAAARDGRDVRAPRWGWPAPEAEGIERCEAERDSELAARRNTCLVILLPLAHADRRVGHLHLEFDHGLPPTERALTELARGWAARLARSSDHAESVGEGRPDDRSRALCDERTLVARALDRRLSALNIEPPWVVLHCAEGEAPHALAARGSGEVEAPDRRALERLDRRPGAIGRACCVPLADGDHWLVARARSPRGAPSLLSQLEGLRGAVERALGTARAAESFRRARGWSPLVAAADGGPGLAALTRAARGPFPLLVVGSPGSGRRTVARLALGLAGCWNPLEAREPVEPGARGTLAVADGRGSVADWMAALGRRAAPSAIVVESQVARPGFADGRAVLCTDRRLERWGALVDGLCEAIARDRRRPTPRIDRVAGEALWRQGLQLDLAALRRLLEGAVERADRDPRGLAIGVPTLRAAAAAEGLEWIDRCPSRSPDRGLLRAALVASRTRSGRVNKRAAARHLGWDVATLNRRLAELAGPGDAPR